MENRAHALAAGLFLLVLAAAAAAALWWLSGKRDFTNDYVLVSSGNVTGLNPEAQVRYRGMRAGKVVAIDLDPAGRRNILVTIRIDADLPVTRSTRAQLAVQGVTGLAYIQLTDSGESNEPLASRDGEPPRIALEPSQWEQLSEGVTALVAQARRTAARIDAVLDPNNAASITRTLAHLEAASAGIERAAHGMPEAAGAARAMLAAVEPARLRAILANAEKAAGEAAPAAAQARALVARMDALVARLDGLVGEAGDEVLGGTLARADELLRELSAGARSLRRLAAEIESDPQEVVFGRPAPPPGPGEAGFEVPAR